MWVGRSWTAYLCLDRSGFCVMKESLIKIASVSLWDWRIPTRISFEETDSWL
jgi:hypothetical protein